MPGLEFRAIRKSFGAVRALSGVSFSVREGEAHAIVGENGAGKSTLLKILAGIVRPDAGDIQWRDAPLDVRSPREAIDRGVGMVYQEMLSFPNLSVSANVFVRIAPDAPAGASYFPTLFRLGGDAVHIWPGLTLGLRAL